MTNTSRCRISGWVLLALIGGSGARAQESGAKGTVGDVLTVCEVLESADKYDGKNICVRGEVITDRHGYSLRCSNASPKLRELWRPFPMEISLQRAVGSESSRTIKRMETLLCFLRESTARELEVQIVATYAGTLRLGDARRSTYYG